MVVWSSAAAERSMRPDRKVDNKGRLRFTLEEMENVAIRLAIEHMRSVDPSGSSLCLGAVPDKGAPKSRCSKHPVVWSVGFVWHAPEVVLDGGDLWVQVNVETQSAVVKH